MSVPCLISFTSCGLENVSTILSVMLYTGPRCEKFNISYFWFSVHELHMTISN